MNLKTVHLLLTQKDNSCLLNYRVPENRFCLISLILGKGKISSLNKKRWKSHCEYDSRTGTTVVYNTKRLFCPLIWTQRSCHVQSRYMVSLFYQTKKLPHVLFHYFYAA